MKKVALLFLVLFVFNKSNAQSDQNRPIQTEQIKVEGTYQIQVVNSRNKANIPSNIAELVKKNRKPNEINYLKLGTEVRLMILPESTISAPNFSALPQIAYIRE